MSARQRLQALGLTAAQVEAFGRWLAAAGYGRLADLDGYSPGDLQGRLYEFAQAAEHPGVRLARPAVTPRPAARLTRPSAWTAQRPAGGYTRQQLQQAADAGQIAAITRQVLASHRRPSGCPRCAELPSGRYCWSCEGVEQARRVGLMP
jgi:hypothetical protein